MEILLCPTENPKTGLESANSKLDIGGGMMVFLKTVVRILLLSTEAESDRLFV